MEFFAKGQTRDRLSVLYVLRSMGAELTREQLAETFLKLGLAPYFDLQAAIHELETTGMLAAVPRPQGICFVVSDEGIRTLELFEPSLPVSYRESIDAYCAENKSRYREDSQYVTTVEPQKAGCIARMKLIDCSMEIFEVAMLLPDEESARRTLKRWRTNADRVYARMVAELSADRKREQEQG